MDLMIIASHVQCAKAKAHTVVLLTDYLELGCPVPNSKEWNDFTMKSFQTVGDIPAKIKVWIFRALALMVTKPSMCWFELMDRTNAPMTSLSKLNNTHQECA